MVGTIFSMVHGDPKQARTVWPLHLLGGVAGGLLAGATLWFLSNVIALSRIIDKSSALVMSSLLCFAYAMHELRVVRLPQPQLRRQVSEVWAHALPIWGSALVYGFLLGLGMTTYLTVTAIYPALFLGLASSGWLAVAVMTAFGVGRVAPVVTAGIVSVVVGLDLDRMVGFLDSRRPYVHPFAACLLVGAGTFFWVAAYRG